MDFNFQKTGFPTFQEYAANPQKYHDWFFGKETETLDIVADGNKNSNEGIRKATKSIRYEIFNYKTKKLEEVEKIARENGIDLRKLKFRAIIQNTGGHFGEIVVKFMSEAEYNRRSQW